MSFALGTSYYPLAAPANDDARRRQQSSTTCRWCLPATASPCPRRLRRLRRLDVAGKAVLIFSHEPQEHDPNSRFNGTRPMPQTTLQAKAAAARSKGARALLVVSDPSHQRGRGATTRCSTATRTPRTQGIPVLRVRRDEMQPLIDAWGLDAVARLIDRDLDAALAGADRRDRRLHRAPGEEPPHGAQRRRHPSRQRSGAGEGSGRDRRALRPRRTRRPALGDARTDRRDSQRRRRQRLRHGVDHRDGARRRGRPRRGFRARWCSSRLPAKSAACSARRTTPATRRFRSTNTIAMLNLDMVGRARGGVDVSGLEVVALDGSGPASRRDRVRRRPRHPPAGPGAGRSDDSTSSTGGFRRSTSSPASIRDYHRPTDDWEKIDATGTKRVATLALELAARLAARGPTRPEFVSRRDGTERAVPPTRGFGRRVSRER